MGLIADAGYAPVDLGRNEDAAVMEAPRRPGAVYGEEYRLPDAEKVVEAVRAGREIPPTPELLMSTKPIAPRGSVPGARARRATRSTARRYRRLFEHLPAAGRPRTRRCTPWAVRVRICDDDADPSTDGRRWRPAGRSSASSSPTTSPPTARRSAIDADPEPDQELPDARAPTSRVSTEPARPGLPTFREGRPGEAPARRGRPRRAAQPRGDRAGRRPAQRHPPVREPDAGGVHQDPQPDRRPAPRGRGGGGRGLRGGAAERPPGTTSGSILREFLPLLVGDRAGRRAAGGRRDAASSRARLRTSPSSSPTPRTATATARSATPTGSTGTSARCRSSRT